MRTKCSKWIASVLGMFLTAFAMPAMAECDYATVKWLQSLRYSPMEAMAWCTASSEGRPDPAQAKAARQVPAPLQQAAAPVPNRPEPPKPADAPKTDPPKNDSGTTPSTEEPPCPPGVKEAAAGDAKAAGKNCVQNSGGGLNALSTFKTSTSNGSSLATAHIATAYTPILSERKGCMIGAPANDWCKALGMDISASLPIQSTTLPQYGKQAVLSLDGGILNVYTAFTGGRNTKIGPYADFSGGDPKNPNPRVGSFDRIYFASTVKDPLEGLVYLKQGIGARGVKTALTGNGMAGLGTAYLGLGFDGPLLGDPIKRQYDSRTGWVVLEAYGTGNAINHRTLETLFGGQTSRSGFFTLNAKAKIGLPGKFFLSAEYAKAYGDYAKAHIGDMALISFGYNNDDSSTPATPAKK